MEQALLETIATLTKKVEDLLVRHDANTVEDDGTDQYFSTRALARDLQTYPRLMEALPSIEVDFFRSPLFDEEKRDIVQSSPLTVDMIYTPPPINDTVTAPIKKLDTDTITLDNLKSGLNLPGRPPQMKPSSNEPLIDPAVLSELMTTKKPTKSGGKTPFRGRQQQDASQAAPKTVIIAVTAPVTNQTNLADGSNKKLAKYTGG
ncbi:hypothetical protein AYI69_g7568, partial [Smittium culicis]